MTAIFPTTVFVSQRSAAAADGVRGKTFDGRGLLFGLIGLLGLQQLLLLAFLGFGFLVIGAATALVALFCVALWRDMAQRHAEPFPISWRGFVLCCLLALVLFLLGGEGRFFYANTDWQVRNAILHDLALYPWPFTYRQSAALDAGDMILRMPLGMYLLPGALGRLLGLRAAELLLLAQNILMLGALLALGERLFGTVRERIVAGIVIIGFSGMDLLGQMLAGRPLGRHLEQWAGIQYSAHVTQAFWVPQHALAGWIGALLFLLWHRGRVTLSVFLAAVPLLMLLSPLAGIGLMPFCAYAGLASMIGRRLRWADIILPGIATMLALPALVYLAAGSGSVGSGVMQDVTPLLYSFFIMLEVGFLLIALFLHGGAHRYGLGVTLTVLAVLLGAPLLQIGGAVDFTMRASIPALAILSVLVAHLLAERATRARQRWAIALAGMSWIVGLATPVSESLRAILFPPAPEMLCNYLGVVPGGAATYVTPYTMLPETLRPVAPHVIISRNSASCWDGPWPAG